MNFENTKSKTLKKMLEDDQSNKGSVDEPIKPLLEVINKSENYYSTSSCSGRIIVIKIPKDGNKKDAEFLYRTHELGDTDKVVNAVHNIELDDCSVWFRQEPAIVHIAAKTLEDASRILRIARTIGFKRCGLFEAEKRFLLELMSTEKIDTIIAKNGELLIGDNYLKILVEEANKRLERTWKKTDKFKEEIRRILTKK